MLLAATPAANPGGRHLTKEQSSRLAGVRFPTDTRPAGMHACTGHQRALERRDLTASGFHLTLRLDVSLWRSLGSNAGCCCTRTAAHQVLQEGPDKGAGAHAEGADAALHGGTHDALEREVEVQQILVPRQSRVQLQAARDRALNERQDLHGALTVRQAPATTARTNGSPPAQTA